MSSETIETACRLIASGDLSSASRVIATQYPFDPPQHAGRNYTPRAMTRIFMRDGFIDRYRGNRLVFPPVLRMLSHYLPMEFPYHRNWKMSEVHRAYWELFPTIDHVVPVARGGPDSEENWMSCSMLTNSIKSNWTLDELNWGLLPSGHLANWDGLMTWFMQQAAADPAVLANAYIRNWHAAARAVLNDQPDDGSA